MGPFHYACALKIITRNCCDLDPVDDHRAGHLYHRRLPTITTHTCCTREYLGGRNAVYSWQDHQQLQQWPRAPTGYFAQTERLQRSGI